MTPLFISFCTAGTPYEDEARELVKTLEAFGLEYDVTSIPSGGSWVGNCARKPEMVARAMDLYPDRPLVWVDADARIVQKPMLFDTFTCDFAVHYLRGEELVSSTMYFAATPAAKNLVAAWSDEQKSMPMTWDQQTLQGVVERMRQTHQLRVEFLPPDYAWIDGGRTPDISEVAYGKCEPVIIQTQASRRLRREV